MLDLLKFFESDGDGYVSLPTGSGKTVIFSELIRAANPTRTLVIVPTKQLLEQTKNELQAAGVGDVWLVDGYTPDAKRGMVSIATYASVVRRGRAGNGSFYLDPEAYDLVVLDEAHHAMSDGMVEILPKYKNARLLGFTATPDYTEQEHRRLISYLPKRIHEVTIKEAIEMGTIAPFSNVLLNLGFDMKGLKLGSGGDYAMKELDEALDVTERNAMIASILATAIPGKKMILSCGGVEHASHMAVALREAGIESATVYGGMPKAELQGILRQFADGTITALCNNKLLTEGFDEPTVEVVVNISPTRSLVRQPQRTGRGLRIDPNNPSKHCLVIDCYDKNYAAWPLFMYDERLAGTTGLGSLSVDIESQIAKLSEAARKYHAELLADDASLLGLPRARLRTGEPIVHSHMAPSSRPGEKKPSIIDSLATATFDRGRVEAVGLDLPAEGWEIDALCAQTDPEAFFPGKGGSTREAKKICLGCQAVRDCLSYAIGMNERYGIWGGKSERERRKLITKSGWRTVEA